MYLRNNTSAKAGVRHVSEPAPTVYYGARVNTAAWVPAPTVLPKDGQQVTVAESGALQTFPLDYPWRGSRSAQYQQAGNAVPPVLALAILAALTITPGVDVPFDAVDLFAGPGGWDEGARALGLRTVGVEYDHLACKTAVAAGHPRVRADVRALPVEPFQGVRGLIGSPPCPTFSAAGKGSGRHDLPLLLEAITVLGGGEWPAAQIDACDDDRTALTLEPLRWALILRPEWIVLEQVKEVLPVWEAMAVVLREQGYSVATGKLYAEEYGVPQTRVRAILMASRTREVSLPTPTHTRYRKGKPRQAEGLLPWVSMADALGWAEDGLVGNGSAELEWLPTERQPGLGGTVVQAEVADRKPWCDDRPATTLATRDLVADPGANANRFNGSTKSRNDGVRVTVQEAGLLQSFPADYPWQGARTKQYQQVGNAVPPLLALAVLEAVL